MVISPKVSHSVGASPSPLKSVLPGVVDVETYAGKLQIEWDPDAAVTPIGQLPFFIQFLKLGGRFDPWGDDCPLSYQGNNAAEKTDILGSLFLSILSGHKRYAYITNLMNDRVNSKLLCMNKVVSDDSARRALHKIEEDKGTDWLEDHLFSGRR